MGSRGRCFPVAQLEMLVMLQQHGEAGRVFPYVTNCHGPLSKMLCFCVPEPASLAGSWPVPPVLNLEFPGLRAHTTLPLLSSGMVHLPHRDVALKRTVAQHDQKPRLDFQYIKKINNAIFGNYFQCIEKLHSFWRTLICRSGGSSSYQHFILLIWLCDVLYGYPCIPYEPKSQDRIPETWLSKMYLEQNKRK